MELNDKEFLWSQRYRPSKIADCIIPESVKKTFGEYVSKGTIPNFLFSGEPGTGKTTMAFALCNEIGADVLFINASMENGIDVLRTKMSQFASTVSLGDGVKVIILDEADYLHASSAQPALRGFMEEFSANCRFIFTCNHPSRIIKPLHSRFTTVDFKIEQNEVPKLSLQMFKRVKNILENENIEYDKKVVAELIKKFFPDFRMTLNELQRYSQSGKIDDGIFINLSEESFKSLIVILRDKKYTEMRAWVANNISGTGADIISNLFEYCDRHFVASSVPQLILILSKYDYQSAFVASHELNIVACLTEIMVECGVK